MFDWLKKLVSTAPAKSTEAAKPADAASVIEQATAALNAGDLPRAVQCYEQAILLKPGDPDLRVAISMALIGQRNHAFAKAHLNRAILLDPANANAYYFLGKIAQQQGDLSGAIELYNEALELSPDLDIVCGDLSAALQSTGRGDAGEVLLMQALEKRPQSVHLHISLGTLYTTSHELEKAEQCYQTALTLNPASYVAHGKLGLILQYQGRTDAAVASFERMLALNADDLTAHSSLLWLLSFETSRDGGARYLSEACRYGEKVLTHASPFKTWQPMRRMNAEGPVLRVGFVSGDLRTHPVGFFLENVLAKLVSDRLELIAYSMNPQDDELTGRIKGHFSKWTPVTGLSNEAVARRIHGDGVDILIDLAGHSAYNRLPVFAWKPAPVQVSWLGYLASTGVPGIDYVLADPVSTPEAVWDQFTEQVWHLPQTFNCFTPPDEHPKLAVTPPPVLRNGHITFGSFQRLNKLSDVTLRLWGRVLAALPQAQLVLRNDSMSSPYLRAGLQMRLRQNRIAETRVRFGGYLPERKDYLAAYGELDIMLDTVPHPGVTTTCEALWMGVPTVTLAQGATLGRIGASLLACAGLSEWVAWSEDEFVALAVRHGSGIENLSRLRAGLRQQVAATPLFDAGRFAPQFEEALFAMWARRTACSTG